MPELPEVETVRRGLSSAIGGQRIENATVRERRLRWPIPVGFEAELSGQTIEKIERRSKYLLFRLKNATLIAHLGMTGSFLVHPFANPPPTRAHDHVDLLLSGGLLLRYNDPRRFGSMHVFSGDDLAQPLLAHLGPEPLTETFNAEYLFRETRRRTGPIKHAIMDNNLVVGVGNIYANEALFRAGIHPNRAANRISMARYEALVHEIKAVLVEAIDAGGSTLRDYVNANGEPGYFQLNYFVYGRDGEPCRVCGTRLKPMRHAGRATVYCSNCQR